MAESLVDFLGSMTIPSSLEEQTEIPRDTAWNELQNPKALEKPAKSAFAVDVTYQPPPQERAQRHVPLPMETHSPSSLCPYSDPSTALVSPITPLPDLPGDPYDFQDHSAPRPLPNLTSETPRAQPSQANEYCDNVFKRSCLNWVNAC
ncbi:MAG: hypothetical protein M1816_008238 [Peltula sp. TS41687]|nr:MAG: hypothetical protein M1816_008238 [Peltula sp. TS41687]